MPYHSISDDIFATIMLNNTRLKKGFLHTAEVMRSFMPEGTIASPYSYLTAEKPKENVWEEVRASQFSSLPSRDGCLFLFEDEDSYNKACKIWWPNQNRRKLIAEIVKGSIVHRGDVKWLDATEPNWRNNAAAYWRGETTQDPLFELVVQGAVFFPEWEKFPLAGMPWSE